MGFQKAYIPENDEEWRLMEEIHVATRMAHKNGLDREDIARILSFMAAASLDPASEVQEERDRPEGRTLADEMQTEANDSDAVCPECEEPMDSIVPAMGGEITVNPCGCVIPWDRREELPESMVAEIDPE